MRISSSKDTSMLIFLNEDPISFPKTWAKLWSVETSSLAVFKNPSKFQDTDPHEDDFQNRQMRVWWNFSSVVFT